MEIRWKQSYRSCHRGVALVAFVVASAGSTHAYSLQDHKIEFNVPVQPIDTALVAYAEQAHLQLVVSASVLTGLKPGGIAGNYDPRTALEILLRNTGLDFQITAPETVTIRAKPPGK